MFTQDISSISFDWVTATISTRGTIDEFIKYWAVYLDAIEVGASPMMGYQNCIILTSTGGSELLRIMWGGKNKAGRFYLKASGVVTDTIVNNLRKQKSLGEWVIYVTRLDVAIDFRSFQIFDYVCNYVSKEPFISRGIKISTAGDFLTGGKDGRTLYIGSRQSAVFCRFYEKGKQQKDWELLDWVRLEYEIKPQNNDARLSILDYEFLHLASLNAWSRDLTSQVLSNFQPSDLNVGKEVLTSSTEKAMFHLVKQYRKILKDYYLTHCRKDDYQFLKFLLGVDYE